MGAGLTLRQQAGLSGFSFGHFSGLLVYVASHLFGGTKTGTEFLIQPLDQNLF